ncbi:hypothetical protein M9Y10_026992 [Tritrichomonas musculus]|uniref:Calpastatin n=1 Tax=Tritrichomonas musculus TaxID=1915356 RepID=A0ABR2H6L4_9EUKA
MSSEQMNYDFSRFLEAQKFDYPIALKEVKSGKKENHWIWYIFPIIDGYRNTTMCNRYSIKSLDEAKEYMKNAILKHNLIEISEALLQLGTNDANAIFGSPDDLKVQACMTLFSIATPEETVFQKVLDKYYNGEQNKKTLDILKTLNNSKM